MKFIRTVFNYDPSVIENEVNNEPSKTCCDFYESLGDKLARYTSCGFPSVNNLEYSEELEIDDEPGFDIADVDLLELQERLVEQGRRRIKKNENSKAVSNNTNTVATDELQSSTQSTSDVS